MIDYGLTYSAEKPKETEILETKVLIANTLRKVERETDEGNIEEWEYSLVEYSKDEYIEMIAKRNDTLQEQMLDAQLALTEVYEMLEVM